ncbi:MAG: hypothetical protein LBC78_04995 [Oscillospiraceae bacterium]|jgi:hypothetical protein|nr:hypothetical protein [Oscillospiraceae bacterium]
MTTSLIAFITGFFLVSALALTQLLLTIGHDRRIGKIELEGKYSRNSAFSRLRRIEQELRELAGRLGNAQSGDAQEIGGAAFSQGLANLFSYGLERAEADRAPSAGEREENK